MKRPIAVTLLGILFIGAGLMGLGYHLTEWRTDPWIVPISLVRLLAIVGGAFLLMGRNWARWLILAWMAFHVVVSAFHSISECVAHLVLLLVIGYFLLTPPTAKYFQPAPSE
jgi:hypothetical protein